LLPLKLLPPLNERVLLPPPLLNDLAL